MQGPDRLFDNRLHRYSQWIRSITIEASRKTSFVRVTSLAEWVGYHPSMLWRVWVLVGVVVLAGAGCSFKPLVLTPKAATPDGVAPVVVHAVPTVLVLDGSGSMNTDDAPGPRIDAAKAAAHNLIKALPEDARIGLQT